MKNIALESFQGKVYYDVKYLNIFKYLNVFYFKLMRFERVLDFKCITITSLGYFIHFKCHISS